MVYARIRQFSGQNVKRFDFLVRLGFSCAAIACAAGGVLAWRDLAGVPMPARADDVPEGRRSAYYAAIHQAAILDEDWDLAVKVAEHETQAAPHKAGAWNRLAYSETMAAGRPTRSTLQAMLSGYENAPYPAPADMRWRVEFAARYWAAMPDVIQDRTLSQIKVLAQQGETWEVRNDWCKTFPEGALKTAACASVGTKIKRESRP